jgi:hypothetical protein
MRPRAEAGWAWASTPLMISGSSSVRVGRPFSGGASITCLLLVKRVGAGVRDSGACARRLRELAGARPSIQI